MKKITVLVLVIIVAFSKVNAQETPNTITTAAPFLLIAPDARAGGMGDIGVATSPDSYSQETNRVRYLCCATSNGVSVKPRWRKFLIFNPVSYCTSRRAHSVTDSLFSR